MFALIPIREIADRYDAAYRVQSQLRNCTNRRIGHGAIRRRIAPYAQAMGRDFQGWYAMPGAVVECPEGGIPPYGLSELPNGVGREDAGTSEGVDAPDKPGHDGVGQDFDGLV